MAFEELKNDKGLKPIGPEDAEVYILGSFPSERELLMGRCFSGQGGEILKTILEYLKINPDKIRYNYAVNYKVINDSPSELQINECRKSVFDDIGKVKPKVIVAMGNTAIKTLFNRSEPGIHGWRGLQIPMQEFNCWVLPVYPMLKILKDGVSDNNYQWTKGTNHTDTLRVLREDLSIIPDLINIPLPKVKPYKIVHLLKFDEVMQFFETANKKDFFVFFVFDYETIGLKPYFEESCILTSSFTFDGETVYAFPISYYYYLDKKKYWNSAQEQTILNKLRELLTNPNSRKGMHNSVFEMEWSKAILGIDIVNVEDSMLQKYILDCRNGTSSLDFLAFVNWGVTWKTYPDSIMSNLTQLPLPELLDYNGKDSIFEYRLFKLQETALNKNKVLNEVYYEQVETAITIADIQYKGACTNEQSRDNLLKGYIIHRKSLEQELLNLDSVKEFRTKYGKVPALKSNSKDIPAILFKIEGLDPFKKTDKGNYSVDKEVLMQYASKSKFCELLLKFREYSGIEGKILKSYTECVFPDGRYHTNFYPIETGRLGCIAKGTKIQVVCDRSKYPEGKNIEDIKEGDFVYTFDDNMDLRLKKVLKCWNTGDKEIIRIHWKRNGSKKEGFLDLTPEHRVRLLSGEYIKAKDLKILDRVLATNVSFKLGYGIINATKHTVMKEHRFIYKECIGEIDDRGIFGDSIHHINSNKLDNRLDNLQKLKNGEHGKLHLTGRIFSEESIKKQKETRKIRFNEGLIKYKYGKENPVYIELSKFTLLKLLAKAGGKVTKIKQFCYATIINKLKEYNINYKNISKRYSEDGKYISKGKLKKLINSGLFHKDIYTTLNIGYFRLNELIEYYNLNYIKRNKWGNKHNHWITKIEYLNTIVPVYDIEVEDTHNFIANELCVHNSSNINLQNLDKRKHPEIRQIIVAPEGYVLIIFDYAQLEARVLAALSNCRNLIDAIKTGYDIHLAKTYEIWGEDFIKKLSPKEIKAYRYKAKNEFVFPSFYGAKPKSVAKWLDISETHAQNVQDKLWFDFPEIKEWQDKILKIYEKKRFIEIPPGRRRYAPLTINEILNTPVQGGAASIVSKVMNKIRKRGYWVYLNCHDELVTCVKEREAKHSMQEIQGIMQIKQYDFMGDTPLVVEGSVGFDWYNTFLNNDIFG